jgi:uncharacterized protein (DUF2336 family)
MKHCADADYLLDQAAGYVLDATCLVREARQLEPQHARLLAADHKLAAALLDLFYARNEPTPPTRPNHAQLELLTLAGGRG